MKFKLENWQRDFNRNVYAGLSGGLLVYFSQIVIEWAIKKDLLPNIIIYKIFGVLILALLLFIILVLNFLLIKKFNKLVYLLNFKS